MSAELGKPSTVSGQPCPFDTDGDGDCGRRYCPFCRNVRGAADAPKPAEKVTHAPALGNADGGGYEGTCSCGWRGSLTYSKDTALLQAITHSRTAR